MTLALVAESRIIPSNTIKKELSKEGETEQSDEDALKNKLSKDFLESSEAPGNSQVLVKLTPFLTTEVLPSTYLETDRRPPRLT